MEDTQDLKKPTHQAIESVASARLVHNIDLLVERDKSLFWQDGNPSVWAACEFASMHRLRDYNRGDRGLDSANLYVPSY